jgi:hypothetical protein
MRAHTITTNGRVGASARTTRTVVPGGILALSLAVVLMGATASTASATTTLNLTSVDFGDHKIGATSSARRILLEANDTFNPRISVSGDYAQTNNCAASRDRHCSIKVTFTPTSTGPKDGTLSTGPGGPTATLTGNGVTTPPALPLTFLDLHGPDQPLGKTLYFFAKTNYDSTLVARGSKIKKTKDQLVAGKSGSSKHGDPWIQAKLKQSKLKRLREKRTRPHAKVTVTATDEWGRTATDKVRVRFCRNFPDEEHEPCRWPHSRQ